MKANDTKLCEKKILHLRIFVLFEKCLCYEELQEQLYNKGIKAEKLQTWKEVTAEAQGQGVTQAGMLHEVHQSELSTDLFMWNRISFWSQK